MTAYRDDRDALRLRVEALLRETEAREGRVTDAFWRCIPDDERSALGALRGEVDALRRGGDASSLHAAIDALERFNLGFDRVFDELDAHERSWRTILDDDDDDAAPPSAFEPRHAMVRECLRLLRRLDARARIDVVEDPELYQYAFRVKAALRIEDAPMTFELASRAFDDNTAVLPRLSASTTIPRGLPRLLARPETWMESLFRGLRRRRDQQVGDERFDSYFHLDCEAGAIAHLITPEVRGALLAVASVDVPTLRVIPPTATIAWSFSPTDATLAAATRCLVAIRRAKVLPLRR